MRDLHTPLCSLLPQLASHAPAMFDVLSDPAIYSFENQPPASLAWLQQRYQRLEPRRSPDGSQQWLNWVLRLPGGALAGYVQATVLPSGAALVAYVLASRHWRQGIASAAVAAMLDELLAQHGVHTALAVLKAANLRSLNLLHRLGFAPGLPSLSDGLVAPALDADEIGLHKRLAGGQNAGLAAPATQPP